MIDCSNAMAMAIAKAERPALIKFQHLHLTSVRCDQVEGQRPYWSLRTREGVTLTLTVRRTSIKRLAVYEDGSAVINHPNHNGHVRVDVVGGVR